MTFLLLHATLTLDHFASHLHLVHFLAVNSFHLFALGLGLFSWMVLLQKFLCWLELILDLLQLSFQPFQIVNTDGHFFLNLFPLELIPIPLMF